MIRVETGLQFLCQSDESLQPNHVDVSLATILGPLALLQPVTEIPFLPSRNLTNECLRQLVNKPE